MMSTTMSRKEKRKSMKKQKRKQIRKAIAVKERTEEESRRDDPDEQLKARLREMEEVEVFEREMNKFEERERLFLESVATKKAMETAEAEQRQKMISEEFGNRDKDDKSPDDEDWEYVEEGPAEIIWKDNEIIVKKKRIKVPKRSANQVLTKTEDDDRPTSNPLPPQSTVFSDYNNEPPLSAHQLLESVAQQTPNFGTEQDKAHCPFHLKTGVCRFGDRCNRTHFYASKSCTLLIKNMYSGPGISWEQDEELEHTDEEIEQCYEEFYEDVHTEFLKYGEIVNLKVCRNGSFHLRGNVYVHYKSFESAELAHSSMNGRYFAGKQIVCEFVSVTRWRVAICGEYMKSRLKTCSRGSACNFIHCFRNPGGDYEWADWDNPPPRHWVKKMMVLFGHSDDLESPKHRYLVNGESQEKFKENTYTDERIYPESRHAITTNSEKDSHLRDYSRRKQRRSHSEWEQSDDEVYTNIHYSGKRHRRGDSSEFSSEYQVRHHSRRRHSTPDHSRVYRDDCSEHSYKNSSRFNHTNLSGVDKEYKESSSQKQHSSYFSHEDRHMRDTSTKNRHDKNINVSSSSRREHSKKKRKISENGHPDHDLHDAC
ncbi:putative U2 splicing factor subunit [Zostera marina]|uniref:Putative U2 splicing factor subunit n=1 Tax=Zostera marina TaxID=29655 RepID=A0A0K9PF01_ZOSMR|nr:putative U2 splicing factor subunit [Zostera marina]